MEELSREPVTAISTHDSVAIGKLRMIRMHKPLTHYETGPIYRP